MHNTSVKELNTLKHTQQVFLIEWFYDSWEINILVVRKLYLSRKLVEVVRSLLYKHLCELCLINDVPIDAGILKFQAYQEALSQTIFLLVLHSLLLKEDHKDLERKKVFQILTLVFAIEK